MKKLVLVLALMVGLLLPVLAMADVQIDEVNFPDSVFRAHVQNRFDKDGDGVLSTDEINAVTDIDCNGESWAKKIKSLKGIEYFTELEWLNCYDNELAELDVSQNSKLENLYLDYNRLTKLDVSKNKALCNLTCGHNRLETLVVGNQPDLVWLKCDSNKLTRLDLSQLPALITLHCFDNPLTELDLSHNPKLNTLSCFNTPLTALDLSRNTLLCALYCSDTRLTELDVSQNGILSYLECEGLGLTKLDVSHNPELWELDCSDNALTELDLSRNLELYHLKCSNNQLAFVDTENSTCPTDKWQGEDGAFEADNNVHTICVREDGKFDLSTLKGFDVKRASNWKGGTVSGHTLTIPKNGQKVSYTYDCGKGERTATFTLNVVYLPQTGDNAPLALWIALMVGSAALALMMRRRRA